MQLQILRMTDQELVEDILEYIMTGVAMSMSLDEEIKDELKPPTWIKGYEGLWWAAVARFVGDKDPDSIKGDGRAYGGVTMIFKAYLKRATGYSVDMLKGDGVKPTDAVAGAKKEMSKGMKAGSSSAASQVSKIGALNKALDAIMQLDGKEFIQAIRDKIYNKYLAK